MFDLRELKFRKLIIHVVKAMGKRKKIAGKKKSQAVDIDSDDESKLEKWDVNEEGFYKDEIDTWHDEKEQLLLYSTRDQPLEPASFSENEESDEEVLAMKLTDSEEEEEESDDDEGGDKDLGPSDRAWGQRKETFYNTDYVDGQGDDSSDDPLAEEEEREALTLQRRMIDTLRDQDFGLDSLPATTEDLPESPDKKGTLKIPQEPLLLSKEERFVLIQEEWPEFLELHSDFMSKTEHMTNSLYPLIKILQTHPQLISNDGSTLLRQLMNLYHLYCANVLFYLTLRASQAPVEEHPVIQRIIQLRELFGQLEIQLPEDAKEMLENAVTTFGDKIDLDSDIGVEKKAGTKRKRDDHSDVKTTDDPLEYYLKVKRIKEAKKAKKAKTRTYQEELSDVEYIEEEDGEEKRAITYQIARNKGLIPKRKKEQRNPRVKHRKKFEKALGKYKRVVRPVEREIVRYGGEKGGIRSRLARSVKIK